MISRDIVESLNPVVAALKALGVAYLIGGSVASSAYGIARATLDIDIVARLQPKHIQPFVQQLQHTYYISDDAMRDAIQRRASFNVIHLQTMIKVDIFIPKGEPFDEEEFRRVRQDSLEAAADAPRYPLSSPEDVILHKLQWYRAGGEVSERQWNDTLGVLKVQAATLDLAYLRQWAATLGLTDLLDRALTEVAL